MPSRDRIEKREIIMNVISSGQPIVKHTLPVLVNKVGQFVGTQTTKKMKVSLKNGNTPGINHALSKHGSSPSGKSQSSKYKNGYFSEFFSPDHLNMAVDAAWVKWMSNPLYKAYKTTRLGQTSLDTHEIEVELSNDLGACYKDENLLGTTKKAKVIFQRNPVDPEGVSLKTAYPIPINVINL